MKTFDDIEALWKDPQPVTLPAADEIIRMASKEKNQVATKIFRQAAWLLLAVAALIFVLCVVRFEYASSYIGITLMFACIIVFGAIRLRQSRFLKKLDFSEAPSSLLHKLEEFHVHQKKVNTTGVLWYTIVLNIAFAFYFYETLILAPFTNTWRIVILLIYIAWMLIATLWLGKRSIRKEHAKTSALIEKIKVLQAGLLRTAD